MAGMNENRTTGLASLRTVSRRRRDAQWSWGQRPQAKDLHPVGVPEMAEEGVPVPPLRHYAEDRKFWAEYAKTKDQLLVLGP